MTIKNLYAVIGTREPTEYQKLIVKRFIESRNTDAVIISGCAYGTDAYALELAHNRQLKTIGCLPWDSYNKSIQAYCTTLQIVNNPAAFESVQKHHPAPERLSQGALKLHARNYDIIVNCTAIVACPSDKIGGGGTGQGIRLVKSLGIKLAIVTDIIEIVWK